jgi:hypothetical protein
VGELAQVALLLTARGTVCSVWASKDAAEAQAAKYNADPHLDQREPDPDAPYTVQTWSVRG